VDDVINPSGHRIGRLLFFLSYVLFKYMWYVFVVLLVLLYHPEAVYGTLFTISHSQTPFFTHINTHKQTTTPGTAEIESALVSCAEFVSEAAVVGFPHEIKGEGIGCYVILR